MLTSLLLRTVPEHLIAGVQAGDLQVYGSIIRSVIDRRIAGHLQETSALQQIVAGPALSLFDLTPPGMVVKAASIGIDAVGHATSFVQNEQIKAAVQTVQDLQLANIAVSAAGIGVSVAGFAIIAAKLGRVEAKVDGLSEKLADIARGIESLKRERISEDFTRLKTAAQMFDEAWDLADSHPQYRRVAEEAIFLSNQFERRATEVLDASGDAAIAEPFVTAQAVATTIRVKSRLASGEDAVARKAAIEGAETLNRLGDKVSLAASAIGRTAAGNIAPGSSAWEDTLHRHIADLRDSVDKIRDHELAAIGSAMTLQELERQGISGRVWLETARDETESPLLFLQSKSA